MWPRCRFSSKTRRVPRNPILSWTAGSLSIGPELLHTGLMSVWPAILAQSRKLLQAPADACRLLLQL